ncbi:hypothetical protein GCM10010411_55200 [Actinomadura fulvescens]|uniref:Uncharacterized protein n=1 Tax=Actinomadura fulvescens TaxID=46160 RepID=A0ABP6CC21_9ACTN
MDEGIRDNGTLAPGPDSPPGGCGRPPGKGPRAGVIKAMPLAAAAWRAPDRTVDYALTAAEEPNGGGVSPEQRLIAA